MINMRFDGIYITCDKCNSYIRKGEYGFMTDKSIYWYEKKRKYCGKCIQKRIHREDPNWNYDEEFSYKIEPFIMDQKLKDELDLLISCMC